MSFGPVLNPTWESVISLNYIALYQENLKLYFKYSFPAVDAICDAKLGCKFSTKTVVN